MESKLDLQKAIDGAKRLLIEPVWNRNTNERATEPLYWILLIEPVWNRNLKMTSSLTRQQPSLLIEPVWNRNLCIFQVGLRKNKLLIEPVWNRNFVSNAITITISVSFNRTSMESKLFRMARTEKLRLPKPTFNRTSMESKL